MYAQSFETRGLFMVETASSTTGVLPDGGRLLPLLAPRQLEALRFIHDYAVKNRDYPTGGELGEAMGMTKQAASSVLATLVRKGYAYRDRNLSERNIRLTEAAKEKMQIDAGDLFPRT
jgi:DNA-binding MarR family transcriptional regulator